MLRFDSKNVTFNAASTVDNQQIAYFSANRNNSRVDVSVNIENLSFYIENLNTFESDFVDFMADVSSIDD